ncbi:Matrix metalloproteinase-25 [Liparis tanakae]|uniref:Matrix metalloproteinase-25 n=1 Tax=Liparis tanakae TaxID=230148 RepID=A0A4Z2GNN5_9TELE|nr:Matrix metalloproteinase-25 [Liparis tanakae]
MELGRVLLMLLTVTGSTSALPEQYRAVDWLSRYGYLPPPDPRTSRLQTKEGIENAIRLMQRFGGVQESGVLDTETLKLMSTPRCSLPDVLGNEDMLRKRRRRYALSGLKWHKTDLTWSVHSYPSASLSPGLPRELVDTILTHAFKAWSDEVPLSFRRLPGDVGAAAAAGGDIRVAFARSLHDDGYPFDGQGGTLAHAFFPGRDEVAGDTHFDDDEIWSYGGAHFWRTKRDGSLVSLNPAQIKNFWIGLPQGTTKVDAVYERKSDSTIIFFIGPQYWVFKDTVAMSGYPRPLSEWGMRSRGGVPVDRVEAAFIWAHNGKTYLFSAGEFWRFDDSREGEHVTRQPEAGYPRDTGVWGGVPTHMDDVISWGAGDAYFFKDNRYWVLQSGGLNQDAVAPKSIGVDWLRCPAPPTTPTPRIPKCGCDLKASSPFLRSGWLLLISVMLVVQEFLRK